MAERKQKVDAVGRFLRGQPDRIAALWRRMRLAGRGEAGASEVSLLDGLVEPFIHEMGVTLDGDDTSPWARTRGVLRLSPERGARGLHDEFTSLRRCLVDTVEVLGGTEAERRRIHAAIDEAVDSAVALLHRLLDPRAEGPRVPFGGLVVEYFEKPSRARRVAPDSGERPSVH